MISYAPLWQTMKRQGASTYTLQVKGGISSSTIQGRYQQFHHPPSKSR